MTREEVLALYRPMRQAVPRITGLAVKYCTRADLNRAAKQIGIWSQQELKDPETANMVCDIALFEPNQRGRLVFNTFYQQQVSHLDAFDRGLADRVTATRFSLFHAIGKHEVAGVWLEDLLDDDRRLWVMDEAMETSISPGMVFGMRVFDAGPFHMGFGLVVTPDDETIDMSVGGQRRNGRQPFRHGLAATLYGEHLMDLRAPDVVSEHMIEALSSAFRSARPTPKPAQAQRSSKRKPRGSV